MMKQWLLWRIALPLAITATVMCLTWGRTYFDMLSALVWTAFLAHLLATSALKRTYLLDTGSFFFLLFVAGPLTNFSEARGYASSGQWIMAGVASAAYLALSFVGRYRAALAGLAGSKRDVSAAQLVIAVIALLLAVAACSTSKTAVGFLLVPALLGVPLVLHYALFERDKTKSQLPE